MNKPKTTLASLMVSLVAIAPMQFQVPQFVNHVHEHVVKKEVSSHRKYTKRRYKKLLSQNRRISLKWNVPISQALQDYIAVLCKEDGVSQELVYAVMSVETGDSYNPDLVSPTDDYGLFQINVVNRPWLSQKFGITNWFNPFQNSEAGIYMLGQLEKKYGNVNEVLLAYNNGEAGMESLIAQGIWNTDYTIKAFSAMKWLHESSVR